MGGGCLEGKVRESGGVGGGCLEGKVRESGATVCTGTRNVYANHHEMGRQVWFMRQVVRKKLCVGGGGLLLSQSFKEGIVYKNWETKWP